MKMESFFIAIFSESSQEKQNKCNRLGKAHRTGKHKGFPAVLGGDLKSKTIRGEVTRSICGNAGIFVFQTSLELC